MQEIPRGEVFHDMIEEIAVETELPVAVVMELIADALDTSVAEIKSELRKVESPYVFGSSVILGYIDGEKQKRTTVKYKADTLFIGMRKKIYGREKPPIEDLTIVLNLLKDHMIRGFFEGAPT